MAVAARPAPNGNSSSIKVALIVFVCLTVASLGLTIWMYTTLEETNQRADAKTKAAEASDKKAAEAKASLETLAFNVLGKRVSDKAEVDRLIKDAVATVFGKEGAKISDLQKQVVTNANIRREDPFAMTLQNLYKGYEAQTTKLAEVEASNQRLTEELKANTAKMAETEKSFLAEAEAIRTQLGELEKQVAGNRDAWDESVTKLRQQSQAEGEKASELLTAERRQRQSIEQQLTQNKERIDELVTTLSKFRPSGGSVSLLQIADGKILQTVTGENIVYINLGARDHVKPGMTFAVYSRVRGIPADGKGKATIRVTNVFDTTSEAEVTTSNTSDPVVEGDIIANPIYDRNRKFNFVVAGDFDLSFTGKIDDPDGEQVRKMIQEWGGQLSSTVDTRTDFVVLGAAPTPSVTGYSKESIERFNAVKNEARLLGIPVLTRTQFLQFVGFGIPRNAKEDQLPS